jgi:hypothetical protein
VRFFVRRFNGFVEWKTHAVVHGGAARGQRYPQPMSTLEPVLSPHRAHLHDLSFTADPVLARDAAQVLNYTMAMPADAPRQDRYGANTIVGDAELIEAKSLMRAPL